MVSIEDSRSPPRASRRRMVSYKADDDDSASLHSAGSVLSLDSEIDDVKKPSEMVSSTIMWKFIDAIHWVAHAILYIHGVTQ